MTNNDYLKMFLAAKNIEGCSPKTIKYYKEIVEKLLNKIGKSVTEITTEDLRLYLAEYKQERNCPGTTMDTLRRVFSSFFYWLEDEHC